MRHLGVLVDGGVLDLGELLRETSNSELAGAPFLRTRMPPPDYLLDAR